MIRTFFLSVLMLMIAGFHTSNLKAEVPPENSPCAAIAAVDLQNTTLNKMKFIDGEACTSDSPEFPDNCDWKHTISRDEILRPVPGKEVRLVILHSDHETGSGAWDTVLVFDCLNGNLTKIFEKKDLAGVKTDITADGKIALTFGVWQPKDPMCCPSKEKKEVYRWSSGESTYILQSAKTVDIRKL